MAGVPFLGFAPFFGPHPQDTFLALRIKYGKLFSIYMGPQLAIVLNDYQAIKAAYLGQADTFTGRANGFVFSQLSKGHDGNVHGTTDFDHELDRSICYRCFHSIVIDLVTTN